MTTADFEALLACPRCDRSPLETSGEERRCPGCKTTFPALDGIPWLFAEPDATIAQWRQRLQLAVQQQAHEKTRLQSALGKKDLLESTRRRLTLQRDAVSEHREMLLELLRPLELRSLSASYESHLALRTRLPSDQGLNTYYGNAHRDWVWGEEENAASLSEIEAVLEESGDSATGVCLVLGAGAGRLAYDLHRRAGATVTVALDFNPLLLFIARRMFAGESLPLYEFPLAPSSLENAARKQTLSAPEAAPDGLIPVLADVIRAPFAPARFDTIVTPWLIDVLSEDLRSFAPRINRLLKPGGRWVNFGSLSFEHANRARRYSREEVLDIVSEAGFSKPASRDARIPYMCSPHSRHGRRELVFSLAAGKSAEVKAPERHKALPDWIVVGKSPVPLLQTFQTQATSTRIHAYIMALIDGRRTVEDMAAVLEQQKLMPKAEAVPAIRNFLIRMYEDSQRNPNF